MGETVGVGTGAPAPQASRTPASTTAGWKPALLGAVGTILVLGVIGEALAFLLFAAEDQARPSIADTARFGGFVFYAFHHVGLRFGGAAFGGIGANVTVALAMLTGTLVALWLLALTGRAIANQAGGSSLARGIQGAKVALPYAALCLGLAFVVRVPQSQAAAGLSTGFPAAHPSYVAAVLWPLGLAAVAGFVGGFRSDAPTGVMATPWGTRLRAAAGGGTWMLAVGLILSFVGLVLLTPFAPDVARDYFRPFDQSFLRGVSVILGTLLVLPNMAAWVLFPAMGSCLEISGGVFGLSGSFCFLSYSQFPTTHAIAGIRTPSPNLPSPPSGYFLFLLAPLVAVLVGGAIAARRADGGTKQEAVGVGALAGLAYALLSLATAVLSTITAKASGFGQAFPGAPGPWCGVWWAARSEPCGSRGGYRWCPRSGSTFRRGMRPGPPDPGELLRSRFS
ncbi:MAG: hypothetical protein E6G44_12015 [Actinobacteria bacterium]|nr:MAG: hypothetical protein E6G44_12015 [Actinomycetota bacterium]